MRAFHSIPAIFFCCGIAGAQNVEIYVSDAGNFNNPPWQILKYDAAGGNPQVFTTDELAWPQDILFLEDQDVVLISNLNSGRINRHNAESGALVDTFAADLAGPTRMKIGPDGLLYVLQWAGSGLVRKYQLDGSPVGDHTDVAIPKSIGLDWDAAGNLYVSSFQQLTVRKFDPDGKDLGVFIDKDLLGPTNLWFEEDGDLLVLDWRGGAVRRFDANGSFVGDVVTGLTQPEGIDQVAGGKLLVGNGGGQSIRTLDPESGASADLVTPGAGGLIRPNAVRIRASGAR